MTRLGATLTIVLLATLTACGQAQPAAESSTPSSSHTANTADIAYLAAVRPHLQGSSDSDVIQLGHQACASLDNHTALETAGNLTDQGLTTESAAAIVAAAVQAYCPQHKDSMPSQ